MKHRLLPFTLLTTLIGMAEPIGAQTFPTGIEVVAELSQQHPPGNVAVTPDGQLIMSQHQFYGTDIKVVKVLPDGSLEPFPNPAWASPPDANGIGINNVLGIRADGDGVVWMLDNPGSGGDSGRLIGWDTRSDSLHKVIYLTQPVIPDNTFLNDFAIDSYNNVIYIADTAGGSNSALIIVELDTGYARRVLEGHASMQPEDIPIVIDGQTIMLGDAEARIGVNPITIDPHNEWVYYGPMSGQSLYRIRTSDLLDITLTSDQLSGQVERFGDKPISDGITIDAGNHIYVTDITQNAIGVVDPNGDYRILYQDESLSWTDGFGFGPDNYIYVTVNQLQHSPALSQGNDNSQPPYYLLRFPAVNPGIVGR